MIPGQRGELLWSKRVSDTCTKNSPYYFISFIVPIVWHVKFSDLRTEDIENVKRAISLNLYYKLNQKPEWNSNLKLYRVDVSEVKEHSTKIIITLEEVKKT